MGWQKLLLYTEKYTNHVNDLSRAVSRTKLTWDFYNRLRRLNDASCISIIFLQHHQHTHFHSIVSCKDISAATSQHRLEGRYICCYVIGSCGYVWILVWSESGRVYLVPHIETIIHANLVRTININISTPIKATTI